VPVLVVLVVVVPMEDMEEVPTEEMVVVMTTFSFHELYDSAVVFFVCVKYDKDL
jgi:hypothetical protein